MTDTSYVSGMLCSACRRNITTASGLSASGQPRACHVVDALLEIGGIDPVLIIARCTCARLVFVIRRVDDYLSKQCKTG